MEEIITRFIEEVKQFAKENNISDFELESSYDSEIDVYFLKHNDAEIEMNTELDEYIVDKINEYFIVKGITNICIYYDCEFADEMQKKRVNSVDDIIKKAMGILAEDEKKKMKILSGNRKTDIYISPFKGVCEVNNVIEDLYFERQRSLCQRNIKIPLPKKHVDNTNSSYIYKSNQKEKSLTCLNFNNMNQMGDAA